MYLTFRYADGEDERVVFTDGVEISDWIGRYDVPGSKYVRGVLADRSRGQLRYLSVAPSRDAVIEALVLESPDNHIAPTFIALTAQIGDASEPQPAKNPLVGARTIVVGGGSSHDFARWYGEHDLALLEGVAPEPIRYTEDSGLLLEALPQCQLLVLANNQPLANPALRVFIDSHVEAGKGLLLLHAATWHNWDDWPDYNRVFVGGGATSHEAYGTFDVEILRPNAGVDVDLKMLGSGNSIHARFYPDAGGDEIVDGLPETFEITDELYRAEFDPEGTPMDVLAIGRSRTSGATYPVLWSAKDRSRRVVALTLGHDAASHEHPVYRELLRRAAAYLVKQP